MLFLQSLVRMSRLTTVALLCVLGMFVVGESVAQRRSGGSFGGSRGSSSRSSSQSKASPPGSFGGARTSPQMAPNRGAVPPNGQPGMKQNIPNNSSGFVGGNAPRSSFGGSRLGSGNDYRKSYGIPRQTTPQTLPGYSSPVMMNRYGGFSDGLMMGYMMGHSSWMWSMPFHPAFYYSRPHVVYAPDGVTVQEVYPPTFSFLKMVLTLLIVGGIVYVIIRVVRARRSMSSSGSSFS